MPNKINENMYEQQDNINWNLIPRLLNESCAYVNFVRKAVRIWKSFRLLEAQNENSQAISKR